jgi:hypothetical protein
MLRFKDEAALRRAGLMIDPNDPAKAIPVGRSLAPSSAIEPQITHFITQSGARTNEWIGETTQNQRESDDTFVATPQDVKNIKAVVAEIAQAEKGIAKHAAGIATLTRTLIVALYRLGSLLMALPGAAGHLRKARGAWLQKAIELCGTKDRVYLARDVCGYFNNPHDYIGQKSGNTGEERAKAFCGTLAELETLIKYQKEHEASVRKREREAAERAARRRGSRRTRRQD